MSAAPDISVLAAKYDRVALVLQGGGALGAYQAGVYQALSEAGCELNWVSGVSIGAINAALIAGNPPDRRLAALEEFWTTVSSGNLGLSPTSGDIFRDFYNQASAVMTMAWGRPGFFAPRPINPWFAPKGDESALSFYDTSALHATLEKLVDFERVNDPKKRFSVGAVNVRTGNFIYFDSRDRRIGPEHIMASGALPPALPAVTIEGESYWDGGLVSNTPLSHLLEEEAPASTLVFQVDLFSASGPPPKAMADVLVRQKDITYSSRTRQNTDAFRRTHDLKIRLRDALRRMPEGALTAEERTLIAEYSKADDVNIVHLIYQLKDYEGDGRDYEFSAASMREHWRSGYEDTLNTLRHPEWLKRSALHGGVAVHDVHREDAK